MKITDSLRTRILVPIGLIIFVVLGASDFLHIRALKQDYLEAVQWRSEALAQEILGDIIRKYGIYEVPDVRRFLGALSLKCMQIYELNKDKNVAHVAVIDESGIIVAHNSRELWNTPVQNPALLRSMERREHITVSDETVYHTFVPIFLKRDIFIGTIDIGFPRTVMEQKIYSILIRSLKLLAVFLIIAFCATSQMVHILLIKPIRNLAAYLSQISAGDIPEKITEKYKGEFDEIRNSLNLLIEATNLTILTAEAIAAGNLTLEVRERSEQDRMMRALNRMIQRLNDIMKETTGMVHAVGIGRLDVRGNAKSYEGGWRELVSGVNDLIQGLSQAVSSAAAMSQEMELARKIQTSLLPTLTKDIHPDLEIAAAMIPADQVGGDFYDITLDRSGGLWLAVGDVSGHGVTPGLIMMMAQTVHTTVTTNLDCDARNVVVRINEVLYRNVRERLNETHFMTFTALKYLGDGRFQYAGAHLSMIVFRQKTGTCELVRTRGVYLNFKKDISRATKNDEFFLDSGDILVLYTDGLTEAEDPDGKMLDIDGFVEIVGKHARQEPEAMKDMIMADVIQWCDDTRADDMTIVVIKRKERQNE